MNIILRQTSMFVTHLDWYGHMANVKRIRIKVFNARQIHCLMGSVISKIGEIKANE